MQKLFVLQGAYIRTKIRWKIADSIAWFGEGGKQGKVRVEIGNKQSVEKKWTDG